MNPIEQAARRLCSAHGDNEDDMSAGAPRWTTYLAQVMTVIDALHEPNHTMTEAGSEIIRHVGHEESQMSYQSDAANVWRFMMDVLHQDVRQITAETAVK
jgi:hypothetical protein